MKWSILYIDDHILNIECYRELLGQSFKLFGSTRPQETASLMLTHSPHAIILDAHMPGIDGFALHREIVEHPGYTGCPVFFISVDTSPDNVKKSHLNGGVDFLSRELSRDELVARLSNKIKHYFQMTTKLQLGNLSLNVEALDVRIAGQLIELTLLEYKILLCLLRSASSGVTRAEIISKIWGSDPIKLGTVNTHLTNLRTKTKAWNHSIKVKDEAISLVEGVLG